MRPLPGPPEDRIAAAVVGLAIATAACTHERAASPAAPQQQPPPPPPAAPSFVSAFSTCGRALPDTFDDPAGTVAACAPLYGDDGGACAAAWRGLRDRVETISEAVTALSASCAAEHCPRLAAAPRPRACTSPPAAWAGVELDVWVELHAASLAARFPDVLRTSPALLARYQALPAHPTVRDFAALQAQVMRLDPADATLDGRAMWFGVTARLLSALFFETTVTIEAPRSIAPAAPPPP